MSQKVLGGKSYKRYPDPSVSNLPNEYGLYPWSMLYARVSYVDGNGAVQPISGLTDPTNINLLLFLSDIPAIAQLKCYMTGATNAHQFTDITNEVSVPFLVKTAGGATVVTVDIGKVAVGYTGAAGAVFCAGFPALGTADVAGVGTVDDSSVLVWANNGVMASPISQNKDEGSTLVPQPIILLYSQYTEALRTSNNIFTDTASKKWLIVGLHDVVQPTPPAPKP